MLSPADVSVCLETIVINTERMSRGASCRVPVDDDRSSLSESSRSALSSLPAGATSDAYSSQRAFEAGCWDENS